MIGVAGLSDAGKRMERMTLSRDSNRLKNSVRGTVCRRLGEL